MSSPDNQNESSSPNCEACQIEVAQKRLALQREKLEVDKQLLRAEKKALRQQLPKGHKEPEKVWKQVSRKQEQELEHCKARIQELEATLQEKEWAIRKTKRYRELQNQVEDLRAQLQKEHDDHEGVVGELQMKLSEQEKEQNLAMEATVRRTAARTETECKLKVDELKVELAKRDGELEKLQAKYKQQGELVEQLETHIMDMEIRLEAMEEARVKKRDQLEEVDNE